jgi:hypothetical protein
MNAKQFTYKYKAIALFFLILILTVSINLVSNVNQYSLAQTQTLPNTPSPSVSSSPNGPSPIVSPPPNTASPNTSTSTPTPANQGNSDPTKNNATQQSAKKFEVAEIHRLGTTGKNTDNSRAAINDIIVLVVKNFTKNDYINICKNQNLENCQSKLVLNLDGRRLNGISPESVQFNGNNSTTFQFHLKRSSENDEVWADLLGNPNIDNTFFNRKTLAGISLTESEGSLITTAKEFNLARLNWLHIGFWIISLIVFYIVIKKKFGKLSNLLRESSSLDLDASSPPFSLGRTQMAWWFGWVIFSYIFVYMVTGSTNTLNDSVLGLLGIGSGTALGAALIDVDQKPQISTSKGFWQDILTSSFQQAPDPPKSLPLGLHRLQLIIWTFILTIVFIVSVYSRLSMPEFSPTLLALQGIVSGTYLGFKFPEKGT